MCTHYSVVSICIVMPTKMLNPCACVGSELAGIFGPASEKDIFHNYS